MVLHSERLAQLQFKDAVRAKLAKHRGKGVGPSERTVGNVEQKVSAPISYIDGLDDLSIKVSHLPLGPTESHIEGMIAAGSLAKENIFVGPDRWREFSENAEVPQAMGYKISEFAKANNIDPAELTERIITDREAIAKALTIIRAGGDVTIYVGNKKFTDSWLAYLGKRRPTQEEQLAVWEKLPGKNIREKAAKASIPFPGFFNPEHLEFYHVGNWMCLLSSSLENHGFQSLILRPDDQDVRPNWSIPQRGFSSFAVEDKE